MSVDKEYNDLVDEAGEANHPDIVRCPACGFTERVSDMGGDIPELYAEGTTRLYCGSCGHEYGVSTNVSWLFTSPAKLPPAGGKENGT